MKADTAVKAKQLVKALCEKCDTGYPCSLCKLGQFFVGLGKIAEGQDVKNIVKEIRHLESETLRNKNRAHDARYGFSEDVKV